MDYPFKRLFNMFNPFKKQQHLDNIMHISKGEIQVDSTSLLKQLRMINLTDQDLTLIKNLRPIITENIQLIIDSFFDILGQNDDSVSIVEKYSKVDTLKGTFKTHLDEMFLGIIDEDWIQKRIKIAHKHVQINLPTNLYMSAFQILLSLLIAIIQDKYEGDKMTAVDAVSKLLNFEQQIVLEEYEKENKRISTLAEEMIRRSDKLSAVGQLAAGVAHEIRNPLTTLKGFVQFLESEIDPHYAEIMLSELDRINLIVGEFLILAKPQGIKYQITDIKNILEDIISLLDTQATIKNIQIFKEFDLESSFIKCDQNQLKQVFLNLLKNSFEAMSNGGEITVKLQRTKDDMVRIMIIDHGIGISEEQIPKLGEPFYTTKEEGTGLGLMVCFKIIENHGGTIQISSQPNKGTAVEISLPVNYDHGNSS